MWVKINDLRFDLNQIEFYQPTREVFNVRLYFKNREDYELISFPNKES